MAEMEAVVLREHGGPEVLSFERIARPEPRAHEVRVAIRAVAMNHMDLWVRKGGPAFKLEYPHRLGCDISGTIDALGDGVDDLELGQRCIVSPGLSCGVCRACLSGADNLCRHYHILGENAQGGYAQYIVVPRRNIAPYPGDLSFEKAAAGILTFMTAWQMLTRRAAIRPGETVLIQGAGSGVGVAGIQIAKMFGCRVIATAGSDEKLAKARDLGADELINYREEDFARRARALTGKRGVDVVFEHVGGDVFARSIKACASGGRIVTCGATAGFTPQIDLTHVFFRQIQILGSTMASKGDLLELVPMLADGRLEPVVDRVLPLADAAEGHRALENREVFGKVVLTP